MMKLALQLVFALLAFFVGANSYASSYEAQLPEKLSTDPNMCAYVPCKEVVPGADSFSPRKGRPPYVEAYKTEGGQQKLLGYVFLSTDIVDIPAYSGKPMVTLIGMDTKGIITGVRILKHSEPILLVGIPESKLTDYIRQYVGKFAGDRFELGKVSSTDHYVALDAISGATVTVIAENQVVSRCASEVAKQVGIIKPTPKPQAKFSNVSEILDWDALVKEGSVQRLTVQPADVGLPDTGQPYIDMYYGYLNAPSIGRSILGDDAYRRLMADIKPNEHVIFIIANGVASFKGSGFVRGGIYDRIQIKQMADSFTFRDTDYRNLYALNAAGAPQYKESALYILRDANFSAAYPWSLAFLGNRIDKETGAKTFANFEQEYWLPGRYLEGGRPKYERPDPIWLRVWKEKKLEIAIFTLLLISAAGIYAALRYQFVRRASHKDKRWVSIPKYFFWLVSIGFFGFYAMAQPSITHVMTFLHSLTQWKWDLFLSDPFIFVFWWFIIITLFVWGRGLFCGWLCPYGSLSEITYKIAGKLGLKRFQFKLSQPVHDKLKWVKYVVFAVLIAVSFYSMGVAEKMAEVEPFKTTYLVGVWNRTWPFVTFWLVLFGFSLFMERPFCKYLCPLGAGLAIPSTFRFFGLKRKRECGNPCHACANGCGSLAINEKGKVDQRECLLCLDCMVLYYDDHACPPLATERRRRSKAGLPLTQIGKDGYFIPIKEIK